MSSSGESGDESAYDSHSSRFIREW